MLAQRLAQLPRRWIRIEPQQPRIGGISRELVPGAGGQAARIDVGAEVQKLPCRNSRLRLHLPDISAVHCHRLRLPATASSAAPKARPDTNATSDSAARAS